MNIVLAALLGVAETVGTDPVPVPQRPTDYTLAPPVHPAETDRGPQRIVSMAPSITEMCAALGLADRIVGRTQYCTHPPTMSHVEVVGGYLDANFEKIISLQPELVLITASSPKLATSLEALGLRFETVPDSSLEDVYAAARKLGDVFGRPKTATALVARLQSDLKKLSSAAADHRATKVLLTHLPLPISAQSIYIAGPGSFLDELVRMAGYSNAVYGMIQEPWARISVEAIIAAEPDLILEVRSPNKAVDPRSLYWGWSALDSVPAIANKQIRSLQSSAVHVPGPRVNLVLYEIICVLSQ